jgi:aminodeoxyfutalosine synthase
VARLRKALGAAARLTGFSLASLKASGWGPLPAILETLKGAGLQEIVDAPVDLVDPSDVQAASDLGLGVGALSVQRPFEAGRVALVLRLRELPTVRPGRAAVAPLAREQSVAAPTTGYHDVRLVALARLALPDTRVIEVDWQQYGPKLAQVALTFGANHLDRVSIEDDAALGRRRTHVEDVRRNITAAGFTPVGREASR